MNGTDKRQTLREKVLYQLAADVPVRHKSSAQAIYDGCIDTLREWLETQIGEPIPHEKARLDTFEIDQTRRRIHFCSLPEKDIWSSRLIYPDWEISAGKPNVRYDWKIDLTLHRQTDRILFGIRVTCVFQIGELEYVRLQLPEPIAIMAKRHGLRASRLIEDKPWYLHQKSELQTLKECLVSSKRMLPLVVMTPLDVKRDGITAYPVDEHAFARQTFGYAHGRAVRRR